MLRAVRGIALLITLLATVLAFSMSSVTHAEDRIVVGGRITDSQGTPIADVEIGVAHPGQYTVAGGATKSIGDGTYTLPYQNSGTYDLVFIPPSNSGFSIKRISNFEITQDQTLDVQLDIGSTSPQLYSGRITNDAGQPMGNMRMYIVGTFSGLYNVEVFTNQNGEFQTLLEPHIYGTVELYGRLTQNFLISTNPGGLIVSDQPISQNFQLPPEDSILTVYVKDSLGAPVTGQRVDVGTLGSLDGQRTVSRDGVNYVVSHVGPLSAVSDAEGKVTFTTFSNVTVLERRLVTQFPLNTISNYKRIAINGSATYTLYDDVEPPTVGALTLSANPAAAGQPVTVTVTATDNLAGLDTVVLNDGSTGSAYSFQYSNGVWTATFTPAQQPGVYRIDAYALDNNGNRSSTVSDYLAVYDPVAGYLSGRASINTLTDGDDLLPLHDPQNKTKLQLTFSNIKYGANTSNPTGDFVMDYVIKNNQNEFTLTSTSIQLLVVQGDTTANIRGIANLQVTQNGSSSTMTNLPFTVNVSLANPDMYELKVYSQGANTQTAQPIYYVHQAASQSNVKIK